MPTGATPDHNAIADAPLVERAQRGEPAAFDVLFDRHYPAVFNFAAKMLGDRDDAADIAQTAFVRAYQALPRMRDGQAFLALLYRTVVNLVRDRARNAQRKPWVRFVDLFRANIGDHAKSEPVEFAAATLDPQALTVRGARDKALESAIRDLPLVFREVLVLHHLQDMDVRDIATAIGVGEGTVKSRLSRARGRLRVALSEWMEGDRE